VTDTLGACQHEDDGAIDLDELLARLPTRYRTTPEVVVEVTGADRLAYLDAMSSQALADAPVGAVRPGLVLDPNGRTLVIFDAVVLEDRVLLILPDPAAATAATELLAGRTFLSDARVRLSDLAVLRIYGPDAAAAASAASGSARASETLPQAIEHGPLVAAQDGTASVAVLGPSVDVGMVIGRLVAAGLSEAEVTDVDTWRVIVGRPAWGREVVAPHLPEELGLLPSHVHLAKGCYPGQEAVARMWMLGRPRRRLAVIAGGAGALEPSGSAAAGAEVLVTTVASRVPFADGQARTLALAMVPGGATVGSTVSLGGATSALVVALPGDDLVPPGHDPGMRRRRDQRPGTAGPPTRLPAGPDRQA
jgi:tRNA-modifying protein YgfZ